VRRKFFDLQQAHASPVASEALERIAALYAIEKEIRGWSAEERKQVRNARARPLLESLRQWFEATLPKLSRKSDTTAGLGVVPGEHTTGGKQKLLGISKRGNSYLRKLFVQGARALLHPEGHVARKRAAGRCHLDFAGGGARRYGGGDFGTRDHLEGSRSSVECDAGRPCQIGPQNVDGRSPEPGCASTKGVRPTDRLKTVPSPLAPPSAVVPYKFPLVS
jgi:hypothetical protein